MFVSFVYGKVGFSQNLFQDLRQVLWKPVLFTVSIGLTQNIFGIAKQ